MSGLEDMNIELVSAILTFLGDYLSYINPIADETEVVYFANLILVIADFLLLQSVINGSDELVELGNNLTVLGDILIAIQESG